MWNRTWNIGLISNLWKLVTVHDVISNKAASVLGVQCMASDTTETERSVFKIQLI